MCKINFIHSTSKESTFLKVKFRRTYILYNNFHCCCWCYRKFCLRSSCCEIKDNITMEYQHYSDFTEIILTCFCWLLSFSFSLIILHHFNLKLINRKYSIFIVYGAKNKKKWQLVSKSTAIYSKIHRHIYRNRQILDGTHVLTYINTILTQYFPNLQKM